MYIFALSRAKVNKWLHKKNHQPPEIHFNSTLSFFPFYVT